LAKVSNFLEGGNWDWKLARSEGFVPIQCKLSFIELDEKDTAFWLLPNLASILVLKLGRVKLHEINLRII